MSDHIVRYDRHRNRINIIIIINFNNPNFQCRGFQKKIQEVRQQFIRKETTLCSKQNRFHLRSSFIMRISYILHQPIFLQGRKFFELIGNHEQVQPN